MLAYAGASLPVLLIFSLGAPLRPRRSTWSRRSEQVVATLVGSIGLIAAVPITTALAALLAGQLRPEDVGDVAHAHAH